MPKIYCSLIVFLFTSQVLYAQPKLSKSDMVKVDMAVIAEKKARLKAKDGELIPAYSQLISSADMALQFEPVSVVQKTDIPPSGNKHDYMSIGPYWWPDASKPNGVPYIRKDGEINPEVKNFPDKESLPKLCDAVYQLSLAYYFSDDEKYAEHASKLIRVWFLDTATKMNPNLNFGQAIKGITTGRAEGLIDTRCFIFFADAITLLKKSKHWTNKDDAEMKEWFSQFLNWMQTSPIGIDERDAANNHGVWYDAQVLSLAIFVDSMDLAKRITLNAVSRLDLQTDKHGLFPLELARTTSLHYSVFIMNAFTIIAQLSDKTGIDFWTLETAKGRSLKKCFDALLPYLKKEKKWKGTQIKAFNFTDGFPLLLFAAKKYDCSGCMNGIQEVMKEESRTLLLNLL